MEFNTFVYPIDFTMHVLYHITMKLMFKIKNAEHLICESAYTYCKRLPQYAD